MVYNTVLKNSKKPDKMPSIKKVLMILAIVLFLYVIFCVFTTDTDHATAQLQTPNIHSPTQGFVITNNNETGYQVAKALQLAFEIEDMHVVMGHIGNYSTMPFYNRHLSRHGRTDGSQIGNLRMLGCLESHREVWTRVQQDSYIFEYDAVPAKNALHIVKTLLSDNEHRNWSVINLQIPNGFIPKYSFLSGQYTNIGQITQTCVDCIAYGTRGYIITKEAAQILLQNYNPPVVQVDSYMSLLNAYHPQFKNVWTRVSVVDLKWHPSTIAEPFEWFRDIKNKIYPCPIT